MGRQSTLSAVHTEVTTPPPTARSAIANGSRLFLENVDGRSAEARRFRDVLGDLVQHLGGADVATEPQKHLARRAAALATWCERTEMSLANGQDMDVAAYVTAANSLRRLLADLGLQRQPRDIGGNLADLLNGRFDSGSLLAAGGSVAHEALRGRPQSAGGIGGHVWPRRLPPLYGRRRAGKWHLRPGPTLRLRLPTYHRQASRKPGLSRHLSVSRKSVTATPSRKPALWSVSPRFCPTAARDG